MRRWLSLGSAAAGVFLLAALALWIAWLLGGNPGYFSHDELQWAVYAEQRAPAAAGWLAIDRFQYRPLTFQLWMLSSRALFETPRLFHLLWLLLGAVNAALLYGVLRRFSLSAMVAAVASLVFWINPFAVFVHGWVGTLGDLLWVMAGLAIALITQSARGARLSTAGLLAVAALTLAALLAKEAALSIPSLLLVAWLLTRQQGWRSAFLASAAVAGVYLLLRFGVLTGHPRDGSGYGIDLAGVPWRFAGYQMFPFFPWADEINDLARFSGERQRNMAILTLLIWLAALRGPRDWLTWFLLSLAALGPALLIAAMSNQYGYGLGAVLVGLAAWRWQKAGVLRRALLLFALTILCWHAIGVAQHMREVGEIQVVFSPSLSVAVANARPSAQQPLGLRADCEGQRWIYQRLSRDIPRYNGVAIGPRVRMLAADDASMHSQARIDCRGRVYLSD